VFLVILARGSLCSLVATADFVGTVNLPKRVNNTTQQKHTILVTLAASNLT